jgi:hypothetical protein
MLKIGLSLHVVVLLMRLSSLSSMKLLELVVFIIKLVCMMIELIFGFEYCELWISFSMPDFDEFDDENRTSQN